MTAFYRLMLGSCGLLVAGPAAFAVTTDFAVAGSTALVTQVTAPAPVVPPTETEQLAADSQWTPIVRRLGCLRGIATLTGFALAVEIGDLSMSTRLGPTMAV